MYFERDQSGESKYKELINAHICMYVRVYFEKGTYRGPLCVIKSLLRKKRRIGKKKNPTKDYTHHFIFVF